MNNKIISIVLVVAAAGILLYDYLVGEQFESWVYICVGLLIVARLITIFVKKPLKN